MLKNQILLNKNRSKRSVNVENGMVVPLSTNERLLPLMDVNKIVNIKEIYDKEKDESDLYRLIFTINPYCTNILFNTFTEVVYKEGSNLCTMLTDSSTSTSSVPRTAINTSTLNQPQAIRDTEYSHPSVCEGLVYHCGTDIFNNHILRSDGFVTVSKLKSNSTDKNVFNTIKDYNRDKDGVHAKINFNNGKSSSTHIYNADNILTFKDAFKNRLVEDDGWFGFTNKSFIDIPNATINGKDVTINKVMNNNKACEFIDMFPDRSLFSFVPKVNKYRNRIENNWDYCLTYPYKNNYTMFQKINNTEAYPNFNGIRVVDIFESASESGLSGLFLETLINHNLSVGEYINLYYVKDGELMENNGEVKITGIGDLKNNNKNRFFTISVNDLDEYFYEFFNSQYNEDTQSYDIDIFFKKNTNDGECDYYFRVFRKLPNFATSTLNINDYNNDVDEVISSCTQNYFKSEISKLSFAQNIYGDKSSQILFTDKIDLTRLVDNNGRKLSEIFLTITKRNQGYKSWYNGVYKDNSSEQVEFSRAFGEVTSGLNLGLNEKSYNYNVRRLHNVPDSVITNNPILNIPPRPTALERDININGWSEGKVTGLFYGDIVERNPLTCEETVLENVYHRFNTAQRETDNKIYSKIIYDVLLQDDNAENFDFGKDNPSTFTVKEEKYADESTRRDEERIKNANIAPEGYFYQAHYRIKINDVNDIISETEGTQINFSTETVNLTYKTNKSRSILYVESPKNYDFKLSDVFLLYKSGNFSKSHYWGVLGNVKDSVKLTLEFETIKKSEVATILNDLKNGKYVLLKVNTNIPIHASPFKSLPYKFKWRDVVKPSQVSMQSDINQRPFTNGTHYINTNINFYLRRQDPFAEYGLQYTINDDLVGEDGSTLYNYLIDLTPYGDYKDISPFEFFSLEDFKGCQI
jgi:hypothetical protein